MCVAKLSKHLISKLSCDRRWHYFIFHSDALFKTWKPRNTLSPINVSFGLSMVLWFSAPDQILTAIMIFTLEGYNSVECRNKSGAKIFPNINWFFFHISTLHLNYPCFFWGNLWGFVYNYIEWMYTHADSHVYLLIDWIITCSLESQMF